jgi:hypothetical protein
MAAEVSAPWPGRGSATYESVDRLGACASMAKERTTNFRAAAMTSPALYAACVEHLTFAPTVIIECLACEHRAEVAVAASAAKAPGWFRVLDLPRILRCENCGKKGRAIIDARLALGHDKLE